MMRRSVAKSKLPGLLPCSAFLFASGLSLSGAGGTITGHDLFWYHLRHSDFCGPAAYVWVDPTPLEWLWLILIATFTAIGMNFFVRGFSVGDQV